MERDRDQGGWTGDRQQPPEDVQPPIGGAATRYPGEHARRPVCSLLSDEERPLPRSEGVVAGVYAVRKRDRALLTDGTDQDLNECPRLLRRQVPGRLEERRRS